MSSLEGVLLELGIQIVMSIFDPDESVIEGTGDQVVAIVNLVSDNVHLVFIVAYQRFEELFIASGVEFSPQRLEDDVGILGRLPL